MVYRTIYLSSCLMVRRTIYRQALWRASYDDVRNSTLSTAISLGGIRHDGHALAILRPRRSPPRAALANRRRSQARLRADAPARRALRRNLQRERRNGLSNPPATRR